MEINALFAQLALGSTLSGALALIMSLYATIRIKKLDPTGKYAKLHSTAGWTFVPSEEIRALNMPERKIVSLNSTKAAGGALSVLATITSVVLFSVSLPAEIAWWVATICAIGVLVLFILLAGLSQALRAFYFVKNLFF
ncbi:hypothetical protein [Glaciibacter psychrotolerans]|uniref:Uncharacterized protein n=1 Tax=Glaciibacter psychrotolerans TaxID=670054 RepID=A0A7Z0J550_9MICO|nr:hypothetical protein [Leifsonia psychrotolerans]NYJ18518.1 hypothetical protein [Leifsonia psychrotolerans]